MLYILVILNIIIFNKVIFVICAYFILIYFMQINSVPYKLHTNKCTKFSELCSKFVKPLISIVNNNL